MEHRQKPWDNAGDLQCSAYAVCLRLHVALQKLPKSENLQKPKVADKFVRMPDIKLQELLYRAFERKQNWNIVELRQHTKQPVEWLKELLGRMGAEYVKKGPNKFTYQLVPE